MVMNSLPHKLLLLHSHLPRWDSLSTSQPNFYVGNSVYLLHIKEQADLIRSYGGKVGVQ
jgi:hypothetical protein